MIPTILLQAMGKIVGKAEFFNLGMPTNVGEEKPVKPRLKLTLCHILHVWGRGVGIYIYIYIYIYI